MTKLLLGLKKKHSEVCHLPLGPRPRAPNQLWVPTHLRMIPTNFDRNLLTGSGDDNENVFLPLWPRPPKFEPL